MNNRKIVSVLIPIAAIVTVTVLLGQFMGLVLTPQEVYAPTSRRGYFQIDTEGTIFVNMNPYASDYMIVVCDDMEQLQRVYNQWKAAHQATATTAL